MDPMLISVATAVAGKATEALTEGIKKAAELVRQRFAKDGAEIEVLRQAEQDVAKVDDLAAAIGRACQEDPTLRRALEAELGQTINVSNSVTNKTGNVTFNNNFAPGGEPKNFIQGDTINIQNLS